MKCGECEYFISEREFCAYYMFHTYSDKTMDCDKEHIIQKRSTIMKREQALNQYYHEVALFEQWGAINTTTFEEWLEIKGITLED